jgi:hypothetical protein
VAVSPLPVGGYSSVTPTADGCAQFPANAGTGTIEYVVVAQSVSPQQNQGQFRLAGDAMLLGPAAAVTAAVAALASHSPAERFHLRLRQAEMHQPHRLLPAVDARITKVPPAVGEKRTFKVCSNLRCALPMTNVTGVVVAVGTHVALYVDELAANQLSQADYNGLVATFDTRLYPTDTLAFGRESDVDGNGVVLVLMTPAINRLVTADECQRTGYVAGYFFGVDLDVSDPNANGSELVYTFVADPSGTHSCSHSVDFVKRTVLITFVHELQHMISFNQHVLRQPGGASEALWLNEALSHYAEELGGRTYLPGDETTFSNFLAGNIRNAYNYLTATGDHFLVATSGNGTLPERGAGWLFIRYVVDQLATDATMASWHAVTRRLVQTRDVGAANIAARMGEPFDQTLARWGLALWVSDLPGFVTPPELRYESWRFRTTYAALYPSPFPRPYPLEPPVTTGPEVDMTGTLRAGSGVYRRVLHPSGSPPFTLQLATPQGGPLAPSLAARLTVIRVQ